VKNFFTKNSKGFTLIELLVVISIIGVLSSIVLGSLQKARYKANDTKRLQEIRQMQTALELYYNDYGQYPYSDNSGCGGWDTPGNGTFITPLANGGYLSNLKDPTTNDDCGNYRYYRYSASSYGCSPSKPFYVIMIVGLESFSGVHPSSPGFNCPSRNWQGEGQWVTGKYES